MFSDLNQALNSDGDFSKVSSKNGIDLVQGQIKSSLLTGNQLSRKKAEAMAIMNQNLLPHEAWRDIQESFQHVIRRKAVMQEYFARNGMTKMLRGGIGTTQTGYHKMSDMKDINPDMFARTAIDEDRADLTLENIPVPIWKGQVQIDARELMASRNSEFESIDTAHVSTLAKLIIEAIERMILKGAPTIQWNSNTIYGLTTYTNRNTGTLTADWNASGADPVLDVKRMRQALFSDNMSGPFTMLLSRSYATALDQVDAGQFFTKKALIGQMGDTDILYTPWLDDRTVVLFERGPETAVYQAALDLTTITYMDKPDDALSPLVIKCFAAGTIVPMSDRDGKCGIAHYTV